MTINDLLTINKNIQCILNEDKSFEDRSRCLDSMRITLSTSSNINPKGCSMVLLYNDSNIEGVSALTYPYERWTELNISFTDTLQGIKIDDYRYDMHLEIAFSDIIAWYVIDGEFLNRLKLAKNFGNTESRTFEDIKQDISAFLISQNPKFGNLLNIYSPEKYLIDILASIYDKIQKYITYAYSSNDIDKAEGILLEQLARVEYNYKPTPPYPTEVSLLWNISKENYIDILKELYASEVDAPTSLFPKLQVDITITSSNDTSTTNSLFWTNSPDNLNACPQNNKDLDVSILQDYTNAKTILQQIFQSYIQGGFNYETKPTFIGQLNLYDNNNLYTLDYTLNITSYSPDITANKLSVDLNTPYSLTINNYNFKVQNTILEYDKNFIDLYFKFPIIHQINIIIPSSLDSPESIPPHNNREDITYTLTGNFADIFSFDTLLLRKYYFPDTIELGDLDYSDTYFIGREYKEVKNTNFNFSKSSIALTEEKVDPSDINANILLNDNTVNSFITTNPLAINNFIWQLKSLEDITNAEDLESLINTPIIYIDFNRYGTPIFILLKPPITSDTTVSAYITYFTHSGYILPTTLKYKITTYTVPEITFSIFDNSGEMIRVVSIPFQNNYDVTLKVEKVKPGYDGDTDEQIRQFKDYVPADKFPYALKRAITNKDYQLLLAQNPHIPIIKSQLAIKETYIDSSLTDGMRLKAGKTTISCSNNSSDHSSGPYQDQIIGNSNNNDNTIINYTVLKGVLYILKKSIKINNGIQIYGEKNSIKVVETLPLPLNDEEKELIFDYLLPFMITSNYYRIEDVFVNKIYLTDVTFYTENVKDFYSNLARLQERLIYFSDIGQPLTLTILQSALSYLPYKVEIEISDPSKLSFSSVEHNQFYYYGLFTDDGQLAPTIYPLSLKDKNKLFVV